MKKVLLLSLVVTLLSSCTMHKESKAIRRNARESGSWHGWSKNYCPQTYGYRKKD